MSDKFGSWEQAVTWLMNQPDKQDLVLDCYYDPLVSDAANRYWNSSEWGAIREVLPTGKGRALDLGAGRGIASYALAKDGWDILAVEPDKSDIVGAGAVNFLARSESLSIDVISEFGEKIPCASNSFDLVFARQVLHHAHDLNQLCAEVYRVLKSGGTFVAVRDHVISSPKDLPVFFSNHPLHYLYGGENAYTENQYITAMKQAGFKVKKIIRSFDNVINYAPYTEDSLRDELKARLNKYPLIGYFGFILNNAFFFKYALKLLTCFDRRPGRLYSFVCIKT